MHGLLLPTVTIATSSVSHIADTIGSDPDCPKIRDHIVHKQNTNTMHQQPVRYTSTRRPIGRSPATTILTCRRVCVQHIRSIIFTNYSVHMIRVRCPGHGHTTSKVSFYVSKSFGHATLKSNITTTTNLLPRWPPFVADTRRRGRACARMRVSLVGALTSVERSPSRTSAVEGQRSQI
ncbi:skin secretory protein xP2-like [Iris pallida]|uniref:Skin secretory protein xP2-like n=1 Tax=Iris pallida TaxID=29817 RepID=A0AAX6FWY7_IRIPA|nr:skin secretory protein xP2-like [Iris pallida]